MRSSVLPLPLVIGLIHHAIFVVSLALPVFSIMSSLVVPLTMSVNFVLALVGPLPPPSDAILWLSPTESLVVFAPPI